ncbi:MAG: hypothetical protein ACTSRS_21985 [Candidatus Helarchaeota archaeon]
MGKKRMEIEPKKFSVVVWVLDHDRYVIDELDIDDWEWHDDTLRIYINESTIKKSAQF